MTTSDVVIGLRRAALLTVTLGALGCGDARATALQGLRGVRLSPTQPKPDFTLTATDGRPFNFKADTKGTVTLLYFGYTNCPDVCPVHLTNIAGALKRMSPEDRAKVRVVFVTTDPARDTPQRLRQWLDNFDTHFVGLSGTAESVNQIQARLGLPPATMEMMDSTAPGPRAGYGVGHAAQVLAFTPDDSLRTEYPNGFT
ncbi:MAG TPA: SCO family protein, partial [Gemmatimonadaceae bacterium]|nr:SCO family protein [Gemmatimonadaceae bacterium]